MNVYYVATLSRYVLVEATCEARARERGREALLALRADNAERRGREAPVNIRTVRLASEDEIELWRWHQEMLASD